MGRQASTYTRVVAFIIRDGALLLIPPWENDGRAQRLWNAPGGALEPYESIEEALIRETFEETGAEIEPLGLAFITQEPSRPENQGNKSNGPAMSIEVCCYARLLSDDSALRSEHPYIPPPEWVPLERVSSLPTLPFCLRGWAKWVVKRGRMPMGVPIVSVQLGADVDALCASFERFGD